jgi:hypothetical protein
MTDILFSYPEHCGESDCPVGWHLYHVWGHDDGTYSTADSDGDHTEMDQEEYNELWLRNDEMWLAYARSVRETGNDVLGEYFRAQRELVTRQTWTVQFVDSGFDAPAILVMRGRNGKWMGAGDAGPEVREYLNARQLENGWWISGDFKTMAEVQELADAKPRSNGTVRVTFTLEIKRPNPNYQRDLQRQAALAIIELRARIAGLGVDADARQAEVEHRGRDAKPFG